MTDDLAPVIPLFTVSRGAPTAEEVAALVAVVVARGGEADTEPPPTSRWTSRAATLRRPLHPGPGAWQWSGRSV